MAKRFTDTEKWDHAWFTDSTVTQKLLWIYLCDTCDGVGIWNVNFKTASFLIGTTVDWSDLDSLGMGSRLIRLSEDRVWIPGFIKFQYKTLNPKNNAHRGMMRSIVGSVSGLPLSGDSKELIESFQKLLSEGRETLGGESVDSTGTGKGKGKGKVKGEFEGKNSGDPFHYEAEIYFMARRLYANNDEHFESFLGIERMKILKALGGKKFLLGLEDNDFGVKRLARLIQMHSYTHQEVTI